MTAQPATPLPKPRTEKQAAGDLEALERAETGQSLGNYPTIFLELMERGIPEHAIDPRSNVLTYRAWLAKGRQVQPGERGVKIVVYAPDRNDEGKSKPRWSSVFHISQTRDASEPKPENHKPLPTAEQVTETADPDNPLPPELIAAGCTFERQPLDPAPAKVEPVAPIEPDPDPAPESSSEHALQVDLTGAAGEPKLTPKPESAEPCPHTLRKVEVGMPCAACGEDEPE